MLSELGCRQESHVDRGFSLRTSLRVDPLDCDVWEVARPSAASCAEHKAGGQPTRAAAPQRDASANDNLGWSRRRTSRILFWTILKQLQRSDKAVARPRHNGRDATTVSRPRRSAMSPPDRLVMHQRNSVIPLLVTCDSENTNPDC
jgi:hypothetical protein